MPYFGLIDARMSASDKHLPVVDFFSSPYALSLLLVELIFECFFVIVHCACFNAVSGVFFVWSLRDYLICINAIDVFSVNPIF